MQKLMILFLFAGLLTACNQSAAPADKPAAETPAAQPAPAASTEPVSEEPQRIDMAKEGPSIVWEQKVAANSSKVFVFYAKKGQKLSLGFVDDTNEGSMDLGKISIEPNKDPLTLTVSESKDYRLSVSNNSGKETSFRISMSLE